MKHLFQTVVVMLVVMAGLFLAGCSDSDSMDKQRFAAVSGDLNNCLFFMVRALQTHGTSEITIHELIDKASTEYDDVDVDFKVCQTTGTTIYYNVDIDAWRNHLSNSHRIAAYCKVSPDVDDSQIIVATFHGGTEVWSIAKLKDEGEVFLPADKTEEEQSSTQ